MQKVVKLRGLQKKTELKLTNVARSSLEELYLDYEDFLRQRSLKMWSYEDPRRQALVNLRPTNANEFVRWAHFLEKEREEPLGEIAANGMLVLLSVVCRLLNKQIQSLAISFEKEGGFTERMYAFRKASRGKKAEF